MNNKKESKRQTMYVNGGTNYNIVKDDVIQIITENGKTTKKTMSSRDYLQLVIRTGERNPIIP